MTLFFVVQFVHLPAQSSDNYQHIELTHTAGTCMNWIVENNGN